MNDMPDGQINGGYGHQPIPNPNEPKQEQK